MNIADLPIVWTCPRCETDHRFNGPEEGCECGYHEEVLP